VLHGTDPVPRLAHAAEGQQREESPTRLLQQLQRIHQQTVRTADGEMLYGLTEMTPAQKSLFIVLQLPVPTPAELSQDVEKIAGQGRPGGEGAGLEAHVTTGHPGQGQAPLQGHHGEQPRPPDRTQPA
jgi:hypothetical protein